MRPIVENRLRILRNLPARISVTTIPEHVHAAIVDAAGKRREADTPTVFKVPAGSYTIELAQSGWEAETHDVARRHRAALLLSISPQALDGAGVDLHAAARRARVHRRAARGRDAVRRHASRSGSHKLLLEHRDYPWHREDLDAKSGAPIQREITLTRPIRSGRTELVVWLDGLRRRRRAAPGGVDRRTASTELRHHSGPGSPSTSCRRRRASAPAFSARSSPRATASRSATARS